MTVNYSHCNFETATKGIQSGLPSVHSFKKYFFSFMLLGSFITYSLQDKLSITSILFDLAIAIDGEKMHK